MSAGFRIFTHTIISLVFACKHSMYFKKTQGVRTLSPFSNHHWADVCCEKYLPVTIGCVVCNYARLMLKILPYPLIFVVGGYEWPSAFDGKRNSISNVFCCLIIQLASLITWQFDIEWFAIPGIQTFQFAIFLGCMKIWSYQGVVQHLAVFSYGVGSHLLAG